MSSYHIINAVWIGVFPMLAVTVLIGIFLYILCCLNQIKIKIQQHRKQKSIKRAKLKMLKQTRKQLSIKYNNSSNTDNSNKYSCSSSDEIRSEPQMNKLAPILITRPNSFIEPFKKSHTVQSAGELFNTQPDTPIEQLEVQELNESPKSIYSRMQKISNKNKKLRFEQDLADKNKSFSSHEYLEAKNFIENNQIKLIDSKCLELSSRQTSIDTKSLSETNSLENLNNTISNNMNNSNTENDDESTQNDYEYSNSSDTSSNETEQKHVKSKQYLNKLGNKKVEAQAKSKPKFVELSKNHLFSDIDNEDDLIFNQDDDSLSSAGINTTNTTNTSNQYNRIKLSCKNEKKKLFTPIIETGSSSTITSNINKKDTKLNNNNNKKTKSINSSRNNIIVNNNNNNMSSMSDMDPDDNILSDLVNTNSTKLNLLLEK